MVPTGTTSTGEKMTARSKARPAPEPEENPVRARILDAALAAFMSGGYSRTSTLEIARRAAVSKRDLYALVGSKSDILAHCIERRARRLQAPAGLPEPHDRATLSDVLNTL